MQYLIVCVYTQAQFLNLHEWFPSTNQAMSVSNEYIQAVLKTEKPMVYFAFIIIIMLKYFGYNIPMIF